jgi:hypothetical protein
LVGGRNKNLCGQPLFFEKQEAESKRNTETRSTIFIKELTIQKSILKLDYINCNSFSSIFYHEPQKFVRG